MPRGKKSTKSAKTTKKSAKSIKKSTAPKKGAAKTKKAHHAEKPHTGQSGPKMALHWTELNKKEQRVVNVLKDELNPMPINSLASACFPKAASASQSNSWVRNSLRRLVCAEWVQKVGRGTYRLSAATRARLGSETPETTLQAAKAEQPAVPAPAPATEPAPAPVPQLVEQSAEASPSPQG